MNTSDVTVPDPVYMKRPKNFSCVDCPTPVLQLRYEGIPRDRQSSTNKTLITLNNPTSFTIQPYCSTTIHFKVFVTTSLPAVTLIYGADFLFRLGLTCRIDKIPTNEMFLHVTVHNNKSTPITFDKESLQFTAHTVLAHYP